MPTCTLISSVAAAVRPLASVTVRVIWFGPKLLARVPAVRLTSLSASPCPSVPLTSDDHAKV